MLMIIRKASILIEGADLLLLASLFLGRSQGNHAKIGRLANHLVNVSPYNNRSHPSIFILILEVYNRYEEPCRHC